MVVRKRRQRKDLQGDIEVAPGACDLSQDLLAACEWQEGGTAKEKNLITMEMGFCLPGNSREGICNP